MEEFKKILKIMAVLGGICLMYMFSVNVSAADKVTIPDRAVRSGKNVYYAIGNDGAGYLYRYNISGKKTLIVKKPCKQISIKGSYLYFTVDSYTGTDGQNQYVYRVKTNGNGLKKLASGYSPVQIGNYIYYLATEKGKNYGGWGSLCDQKIKGIYRMKLNGSGKKCIYSVSGSKNNPWTSYLYKLSGNRLLLIYYENGKTKADSFTISGKRISRFTLNGNVLSNTDKDKGDAFGLTVCSNSKNYSYSFSGNCLYRSVNGNKKCVLKLGSSEQIKKIIDLNGYLWIVSHKQGMTANVYLVKENGTGKKLLQSFRLAGGGW